jgi:hypothetical protein
MVGVAVLVCVEEAVRVVVVLMVCEELRLGDMD